MSKIRSPYISMFSAILLTIASIADVFVFDGIKNTDYTLDSFMSELMGQPDGIVELIFFVYLLILVQYFVYGSLVQFVWNEISRRSENGIRLGIYEAYSIVAVFGIIS